MGYGNNLPKIDLLYGMSSLVFKSIQLSIYHNIRNYELDDPEEFDTAGIRLADSGRTIVNHSAGYRFKMSLTFDDHIISMADYSRSALQESMDQLGGWLGGGIGYTYPKIRVYPRLSSTEYRDCYVPDGGYIRRPYYNELGVKTGANEYELTLIGLTVSSTKLVKADSNPCL